MGAFIYMLFGNIKEVSIGPTSLMALLTYEFTHDLTPDHVILLTFLSGIVTLIMGLCNLGKFSFCMLNVNTEHSNK